MSYPQSAGIPVAAAFAAERAKEGQPVDEGPTVGTSDAQADAARSGAGADLAGATRDSDGVPVGRDDLEEDKRRSGA
ncbi:hypothetical protein AB0F81_48095 [Actinoplanes sp. NPDC024001]|uniref:hypothetical protein n=1 Tax=Actinoplanes sp. NPDC024001 TaxID=3154598 RepID=UPI0033EED80C